MTLTPSICWKAGCPALAAAALALAACVTPQPVSDGPRIEIPPPAPVEQPALPPRPAPPPVAEPAPPPRPAPPPSAPKGTVAARSVYPQPGGAVSEVTEWTLVNGLTVIYAETPGDSAAVVVSALGGAADLDAEVAAELRDALRTSRPEGFRIRLGARERRATGEAEDAGTAVAAVGRLIADSGLFADVDEIMVVIAGNADASEIEGTVGRLLGAVQPGLGLAMRESPRSAPPPGTRRVRARSGDDGALLVLERALQHRVGSAEIDLDARNESADLMLGSAGGAGALRSFSRAETEAAREAVIASASTSPGSFAALALLDLYRERGDRRPARPPAFALDRLQRVRAVSPETLSALAARFAAAR